MSQETAIEWTDATWNPSTGCDRVSPGCDHCYALTLAARLKKMGNRRYQNDGTRKTSGPGFGVTLHPDKLDEPLRWKRPRRVFVNSMSDLFHPDVPDEFVIDVFAHMALADRHQFQVLTKRPRRMMNLLHVSGAQSLSSTFEARVGARAMEVATRRGENVTAPWWDAFWDWPLPNVWLGVSVENQEWADKRIPLLLETPAAVRFLSCEPLIGPVTFRWRPWIGYEPGWRERGEVQDHLDSLRGIHWVIVGGESGQGARPMHPEWARSLRDQCVDAGVPFFFKQWGAWSPDPSSKEKPDAMVLDDGRAIGPHEEVWFVDTLDAVPMARVDKKRAGRELDGRTWDEMPERVE